MMDRMLVTGGAGLLGANLTLESLNQYQVFAVGRAQAINHPDVEFHCHDLSAEGVAVKLIKKIQPDIIIHTAALTDLDVCEAKPELANVVNCEMAGEIARGASEVGAYLVHISTDTVFDGKRGSYMEDDTPNPINVYGKTKLDGEREVLKNNPATVVIRTNFYGWNAQEKHSLAEWFLDNLETGVAIQGFQDVYFNPLLVNHLVGLILKIIQEKCTGLIHVVGRDCISKYDFGIQLAKVFNLDVDLISPISIEQAGLEAERAKRLCLNYDRVEALLGTEMPGASAGVETFKSLRDDGYLDRLKALLATPN